MRCALEEEGFGSRTPDPGISRHGLLFAHDFKGLLSDCEAVLEGSGISLLEVSSEMTFEHVCNWLTRLGPSGSGGTLLMLMSFNKLDHFASMAAFPWQSFLVVFEVGNLPVLHRLSVHLQPQTKLFAIAAVASDKPSHLVVDEDSTLEGPHETLTEDSVLTEAALALRLAHRAAYDAILDVSVLLSTHSPASRGRSSAELLIKEESGIESPRACTSPAIDFSMLRPIHIGDRLLEIPRLHFLLRQKGIALVECSSTMPHLILDHETGVLVFEAEKLLSNAAQVIADVNDCEVSFRTLWLVILLPDRKQRSSAVWEEQPSADLVGANRDMNDEKSIAVSQVARTILASLSSSLLRITLRIGYWRDCWSILQHILETRAGSPIQEASTATTHGYSETWAEADETQHEAMMSLCGLNAAAARCMLRHYTLSDVLGLSHRLRSASFGWIPERALNCLSSVVDGDQDDERLIPALPPAPEMLKPSPMTKIPQLPKQQEHQAGRALWRTHSHCTAESHTGFAPHDAHDECAQDQEHALVKTNAAKEQNAAMKNAASDLMSWENALPRSSDGKPSQTPLRAHLPRQRARAARCEAPSKPLHMNEQSTLQGRSIAELKERRLGISKVHGSNSWQTRLTWT